jgi:hypothetical protein
MVLDAAHREAVANIVAVEIHIAIAIGVEVLTTGATPPVAPRAPIVPRAIGVAVARKRCEQRLNLCIKVETTKCKFLVYLFITTH